MLMPLHTNLTHLTRAWTQSYKENFSVDLRYAGILGL